MKNLSFALALALICISMFSCGEKSIVNPQNEDFKITTFSPVSGFIATEVTLFGENLEKDSIVSVSFGEQTAEILSRSSDSLIVVVPRIAVGKYDITVKTQTKSYVYDEQFEVLQQSILDDLPQIKTLEINVNGIKVFFDESSERSYDPNGPGYSNKKYIDSNFSKSYKNVYKLTVLERTDSKYQIMEDKPSSMYPFSYLVADFEIDKNNNTFRYLKISTYTKKSYPVTHGNVTEERYINFNLDNIQFYTSTNDSSIFISLDNEEMESGLSNFSFNYRQEYRHTYRPYDYGNYELSSKEFLGVNDDATIEIKFTK
jgi:hypothetical protein